ncbi:RrF2 family transcriptional regulator [Arachidicoccus soli]|uniref:Rrf2 family transcriptional regulator n=1 Tax=Arachidicoccus soli TaxID=2341117 RepID=A0A386HQ50_9BACT|nr:Rrf2 family transcriptional regulator [Arachidicoccus soli]AYD47696.1 Rrf2 family transcriptional regulator [Arachidicoccus soli]
MLSKKAKYAMNALVFIAKHKQEEPISVSRISEDQNIPLKFLESILSELRNARIVKSKKGKYGGYFLNASPDDINMEIVMRLFDGAIALLPCVSLNYYARCEECVDELTCGIRQIALGIRSDTIKRLSAATLTDIIKREKKLEVK